MKRKLRYREKPLVYVCPECGKHYYHTLLSEVRPVCLHDGRLVPMRLVKEGEDES